MYKSRTKNVKPTEKHLCRAGLVALPFPHAQKPIESINVQFSTFARLATNVMLSVVLFYTPSTLASTSSKNVSATPFKLGLISSLMFLVKRSYLVTTNSFD